MKRILLSFLCCLALLSFINTSSPLQAQTTSQVSPVPFYRFRVSNTNLGYLYTASFQEGLNAGYTPDGILHNSNGIIGHIVVPPAANATPVSGQGLQPLHRWRVVENGRTYFYLSPFYSTLGGNYTYQGIAGYTFNLYDNSHPGFTFTAYYSQSYGYWFALDGERRPDASIEYSPYLPPPSNCQFQITDPATGLYFCTTYANHGSICKLMVNSFGSFTFTTPPIQPPASCNVAQGIKNKCAQLGGFWDDETCSCQY